MTDQYSFSDSDFEKLENSRKNPYVPSRVLPNAIGNIGADGNTAGKSLNLSKKSGVPGVVIDADLEGFEQDYNTQQAGKIVQANPVIQNYLETDPLHAKISHDDYEHLDRVTQTAKEATNDSMISRFYKATTEGIANASGESQSHQELREQFPVLYEALNRFFPIISPDVLEAGAKIPGQVIGAGSALAAQGARELGMSNSDAAKLERDFLIFGQGFMIEGGMGLAGARPLPKEQVFAKGAKNLTEPQTIRPESIEMLKKGESPPPGFDPIVDEVHTKQAELDSVNLDRLINQREKSTTFARSVDAFEDLATKATDEKTIGIPADAIVDLYASEKATPGSDDGLLGWIPDLESKVRSAQLTGGDVEVSLGSYAARVDSSIHTKLKDFLRLRKDGVSIEEAKGFDVYHGSPHSFDAFKLDKIGSGEGAQSYGHGLYFAENSAVALDYKERLGGDPAHRAIDRYEPFDKDKPDGMIAARASNGTLLGTISKDRSEGGFRVLAEGPDRMRLNELVPTLDEAKKLIEAFALNNRGGGHLYHARILADKEHFLDWDKPLNQQTPKIQAAIKQTMGIDYYGKFDQTKSDRLWETWQHADTGVAVRQGGIAADDALVSVRLKEAGIPGIKYLDQGSRGGDGVAGTRNYVLFDDSLIHIRSINGDPVRSEVPLSELKTMAEQNEMEIPFSDKQLNDLVKGKFEQTDIATASDLKKFQRDVASAGRQVEQALLKGKTDEALKWKQRQVLASKFAKEATKLQSEMTKAEKQFDRFNDNQKVDGVDQSYTNQIHQILEQFGWSSKRNSGTPTRQISSVKLEDFVNNKIANGAEMPVADFLFDQSFLKAYDDLTVEEFRAIADSVATIAHNGREAEKITVGQKKQDYAQTVQEALNQISDVDPKIVDRHPGKLDTAASWIKSVDASLLKMEQLLRWLDGRDKFGTFTQTVMRPIEASKHFKDDMLKDLGKKIKTFEQDKTWMKSLEDKVDNQFLLDWQSSEPRNITRGDLVAIMLHMGNESNFKKLTAPFEYNGQRFQWNRDIVQALVDVNARKVDWDFVQHIWDIHESYWPQIEDLAKRMSGVVPDRIEARSITNEHGSFKGGYMPLDADALWPGTKPNEKGLFNAERYFNSIPPKGYTKARTNAVYPLELNFNKIIETMRQTIHDLAYRESLTNAAKFLDNTEIRGGIQRFFGPEYLAQVRPWLEDIAGNSKRVDDRSLGALNSVARIARERTVTVQMMYRLMTAFKHGAAAGLYSVGEVGSTVVPEMLKLFGTENGRARIAEIYKESGEIRNRLHNSDRDIGDALDQVVGKSGIQQWLVQNGGIATAALDLGTAIPTYEVAYKKALKEGMSKEDAVYAGESAVRDAHGSAGQPDLAAIMRGNEWIKLGTVAFGTFNHNYGRIRDAARLTREGVSDLKEGETSKAFDKFSTAAWRMSWYLVLTAIAEEVIAPIPTKDGEHEGFAKWAAKGIGAQLAGTIPFVRDAVRGWMYGRNDPTPTPISQIESTIAGTAKDIYQGKVTSKGDKARHAIESTGYVLGIPGTGQLGVTTKFLMDLNAGTQKAENPYRFGRGLVSGRSHPEKLR